MPLQRKASPERCSPTPILRREASAATAEPCDGVAACNGTPSATADSCDGVAACIVTPSATADSCDGVAACIVTPCATAESCDGLFLSATAESDLLAFRAGTNAVDNGSAAACCCRAEPDTASNTLVSATAVLRTIAEAPNCTASLGRFLTYGSIR